MISLKKIFFSALLCCFTSVVLAQITVDDNETDVNLVNLLIGSSSCVSATNAIVKGNTFTSGNSYGSFNKNGSSFPFANGIVLSTGSVKNSKGPYIKSAGDNTSITAGDSDLDLKLGINSMNATLLEFDFIPQTNSISFNYIFASNEYQDNFPCLYSDAFAFLIRKNDGIDTYRNLAILEDGTAVSSTNIHQVINDFTTISDGSIRKGCGPKNESYFEQLNTGSTNTSPINYAGQTKILTAQSSVSANTPYHIKLVIANDKFYTYDSAVFLEAGSFSSNIDLKATNNPFCVGQSTIIDSGLTDTSNTYEWYLNGSTTAIPDAKSSTYAATEAGEYSVVANISGCIATGKITINSSTATAPSDSDLTKCDDAGTGIATFRLPEGYHNSDIDFELYRYYSDISLSNEILNPTAYSASDETIVYIKVLSNNYGGCEPVFKITLHVTNSTLTAISAPTPIINDFSGNGNSVELVPPSGGGSYEYSLDRINYQDSPLFTNLPIGKYNAYIRDKSNCQYLTYPITLLDYPRFFTPNGDGYNDVWEIKNLASQYPGAYITLFDRYGKLLQQLGATNSWDGKYIGNDLPADDYWFHVNLKDGRIIKGHFSLKR